MTQITASCRASGCLLHHSASELHSFSLFKEPLRAGLPEALLIERFHHLRYDPPAHQQHISVRLLTAAGAATLHMHDGAATLNMQERSTQHHGHSAPCCVCVGGDIRNKHSAVWASRNHNRPRDHWTTMLCILSGTSCNRHIHCYTLPALIKAVEDNLETG
jgi:hypothetical protein